MVRILIYCGDSIFKIDLSDVTRQVEYGEVKIIGITSKQQPDVVLSEYPYIAYQEIKRGSFDYVIVEKKELLREAYTVLQYLKLSYDRYIIKSIFSVPGFRFQKYISYRASRQTIFSNNCWGGVTSNSLGLQFYSPFINFWEQDQEYLKFLKSPKVYMDSKLELDEYYKDKASGITYPIGKLIDMHIYFNHDTSFENAYSKWEQRKKRINWNNLFVMMMTDKKEMAEEFCKLPYEKKVCFVPFETELPNVLYVDLVNREDLKNIPFRKIVIDMGHGKLPYYDVLELLNGTIVRV